MIVLVSKKRLRRLVRKEIDEALAAQDEAVRREAARRFAAIVSAPPPPTDPGKPTRWGAGA